MSRYSPGDVVKLASGGIEMTVSRTVEKDGEETVVCVYSWAGGGGMLGMGGSSEVIDHNSFDVRMLVLVRSAAPVATEDAP